MQKEIEFIGQNLLTYEDQKFNSMGSIRVYFYTTTNDFKSYSPIKFSFSITNGPLSKTYNLGINEARDLLASIKTVYSSTKPFNSNLEIVKKYHSNRNLIIKFQTFQSGEQVVSIVIKHNESDYCNINIDRDTFLTITNLLSKFAEEYLNLFNGFLIQSILFKLSKIDLFEGMLRGILNNTSVFYNIGKNNSNVPEYSTAPVIEAGKDDSSDKYLNSLHNMNEFTKYFETNEQVIKIDIPENIEKSETSNIKKDPFIDDFLNGNLSTLEEYLNLISIDAESNPIRTLIEKVAEIYNLDAEKDVLPGINENDLKSIYYISKLYSSHLEFVYRQNNIELPVSYGVLKYPAASCREENLELGYTLLVAHLFMSIFCKQISIRDAIAGDKKDLFYMRLRLFTDVFVHSFLTKSVDNLPNIIRERFLMLQKKGFFYDYEKIMEVYGFDKISVDDILNLFKKNKDLYLEMPYIKELHKEFNDESGYIMEYGAEISSEQIINQLVPLELEEKNSSDFYENGNFEKLCESIHVDDNVKEIFLKKRFAGKSAVDEETEWGQSLVDLL